MGKKQQSVFEFDARAMGQTIRADRRERGYSSPESFCAAMEQCTGFVMSKSLLLKIERGEQEVRISQLFAICVTLFGVAGWEEAATRYMKAGLKRQSEAPMLDELITILDKQSPALADYFRKNYETLGHLLTGKTNVSDSVEEIVSTAMSGEPLIETVWASGNDSQGVVNNG